MNCANKIVYLCMPKMSIYYTPTNIYIPQENFTFFVKFYVFMCNNYI